MEILEFSGMVIAVALLIAGVASCFYGSKIFKILLVVLGFFVGAYFAGRFGTFITDDSNIIIVAAIAGGILVGIVVLFFYYVGIFLSGAAIVYIVSSYFNLNLNNMDHIIILVLICAIGGVLALIFHDMILTFLTAIIGAWSITNGVGYFIYLLKYKGESFTSYIGFVKGNISIFYLIILFTVILSILGIISQFKLAHDD